MSNQARAANEDDTSLSSSSSSSSSVLTHERNKDAMQVLQQYVEDVPCSGRGIALLYGCNHGPDFAPTSQSCGFVPISTTWRTTWSVPIADERDEAASLSSVSPLIILLGLLFLGYLAVGGLNWIATWQRIVFLASSSSIAAADATTNAGAFMDNNINSEEPSIFRHGCLVWYLAFGDCWIGYNAAEAG